MLICVGPGNHSEDMFSCQTYEPHCEKTGLRGFRPGPTQTRLYKITEDGHRL